MQQYGTAGLLLQNPDVAPDLIRSYLVCNRGNMAAQDDEVFFDEEGNVLATKGLAISAPWKVVESSKFAGRFFFLDTETRKTAWTLSPSLLKRVPPQSESPPTLQTPSTTLSGSASTGALLQQQPGADVEEESSSRPTLQTPSSSLLSGSRSFGNLFRSPAAKKEETSPKLPTPSRLTLSGSSSFGSLFQSPFKEEDETSSSTATLQTPVTLTSTQQLSASASAGMLFQPPTEHARKERLSPRPSAHTQNTLHLVGSASTGALLQLPAEHAKKPQERLSPRPVLKQNPTNTLHGSVSVGALFHHGQNTNNGMVHSDSLPDIFHNGGSPDKDGLLIHSDGTRFTSRISSSKSFTSASRISTDNGNLVSGGADHDMATAPPGQHPLQPALPLVPPPLPDGTPSVEVLSGLGQGGYATVVLVRPVTHSSPSSRSRSNSGSHSSSSNPRSSGGHSSSSNPRSSGGHSSSSNPRSSGGHSSSSHGGGSGGGGGGSGGGGGGGGGEGPVFAMKVVNKAKQKRVKDKKRLATELKVMRDAKPSPFLQRCHAAFESATDVFFVCDYLSGGDLFYHMNRRSTEGHKGLPEHQCKVLLAEITLGLEHLHGIGFLHRDLKIENVMLSESGHVKLIDFGLACEMGNDLMGSSSSSSSGGGGGGGNGGSSSSSSFSFSNNVEQPLSPTGSLICMAPELLKYKTGGRHTDWWAMGVLAFELFTGGTPWSSLTDKTAIQHEIKTHSVIPLPETVSLVASDFISSLLQSEVQLRLGTIRDRDLRRAPFFADIDWHAMARGETAPAFAPAFAAATGSGSGESSGGGEDGGESGDSGDVGGEEGGGSASGGGGRGRSTSGSGSRDGVSYAVALDEKDSLSALERYANPPAPPPMARSSGGRQTSTGKLRTMDLWFLGVEMVTSQPKLAESALRSLS